MVPAMNLVAVSVLIAAGLPWLAVGWAIGYFLVELWAEDAR